jgi:hypothetical protein
MNKDNELELLVMNCSSTDPKYINRGAQIKFPAGTDDKHPEDRTVLVTRDRELTEETGLRPRPDAKFPLVHTVTVSSEHFKNFYFIWESECEGYLRTEEMTIGYDKMSAPYPFVARLLVSKIAPCHKAALLKLLENPPKLK